MPQHIARLVQDLAERHRYQPQVRVNALLLCGRERGKQMILLRIWNRGRHVKGVPVTNPCTGTHSV